MNKQLFVFFTIFLVLILLSLLKSCVTTFSGVARNQGLYATRNIEIGPRESSLKGDMIIFRANSDIQSASPYFEKNV